MRDGRLQILPTGHGPRLGQPDETAAAVGNFVRFASTSQAQGVGRA
jgi:hypothetical protein